MKAGSLCRVWIASLVLPLAIPAVLAAQGPPSWTPGPLPLGAREAMAPWRGKPKPLLPRDGCLAMDALGPEELGAPNDYVAPKDDPGNMARRNQSLAANLSVAPGSVFAWGTDIFGELGDGLFGYSNTPVQALNLTGATSVAGGYGHSIALKNDGAVWTWGENIYGQLGNGTTSDSSVPVQVSGLTGVTAITAGMFHSMALKSDGTVWAWGYNGQGQLGNATNTSSNVPVQVSFPVGTVITAIAGGQSHSIALKNDGTVWAWGYNGQGQLGNATNTSSNVPVQVSFPVGTVITTIAGGRYHSIALKNDGTVWTWGYNYFGQLGNATNTSSNVPVQVSGLTAVVSLATGPNANHCLARKSDKTVWAWGFNYYGQLGDGTNTDSNVPVQAQNLTNAYLIAVGYDHSVAIQYDYSVWAWGFDSSGQLGNGTNCYNCGSKVPVKLATITTCSAVAAGAEYSLVRKNDGTVWAWGSNSYGQLGNGAVTSYSVTPVQTLNMADAAMIVAGGDHNLALKGDGTVWSWGHNWLGQLGNGTTTDSNVPSQVPGLEGVAAIGAGSDWSFAIKSDGTLWAWGENDTGMLGIGTITPPDSDPVSVPVQVTGLTGVIAVTGGWGNSLALKNDGTVWAWGGYGFGELGNGTWDTSAVPVQVTGLTNIIAIAAKGGHCLALQNDGTLWAWGYNGYGQLGNGTYTSSNVPVVSSLTGIPMTNIAAGSDHSLAAINYSGIGLAAWGWNNHYQLGNCYDSQDSQAVAVYGTTGVTAIAGGDTHSIALKNDHTVWAWGSNYDGQLGNGDTTDNCNPASVALPTSACAVSAGYSHNIALYWTACPEIAPGGSLATAQTWSDKNTQAWPANSGAFSYKMYRGTKAGLPKLLNRDYDSCARYQGAATNATTGDDPTTLGVGDFYWYLVTGVNPIGEGPAGDASVGPRMVNSTGTCP